MGRPRVTDDVDLDIERRRSYKRQRYYKTRDELDKALASQAVMEMETQLDLQLSTEQAQGMVNYIAEHFKYRLAKKVKE